MNPVDLFNQVKMIERKTLMVLKVIEENKDKLRIP